MRNKLVTGDYGPKFRGLVGRQADGSLVCVAPPGYDKDECVRAVMRELVVRQGGDCKACDECPLGGLFDSRQRQSKENVA